MDDNYAAKFGPAPSALARLSPARVLAAQFAASAFVLAVLQPPFVLAYHEDERGRPRGGTLNLATVALVSAAAAATTVGAASTFAPAPANLGGA